jgi:hypothetical protein
VEGEVGLRPKRPKSKLLYRVLKPNAQLDHDIGAFYHCTLVIKTRSKDARVIADPCGDNVRRKWHSAINRDPTRDPVYRRKRSVSSQKIFLRDAFSALPCDPLIPCDPAQN